MKSGFRMISLFLILAMLAASVPAIGDTAIIVDGKTVLSATDDEVITYQEGNSTFTMTGDSISWVVSDTPSNVTPAYGVLFIPESVYDLELPTQNNGAPGVEKLDFDPFLAHMEGARSWVHWDTASILTECGGMMDLSYVCAVESEYPEGNYIVRCVAFYRNDAEKSLVSYHITYQTDETEFYVISYFGHHYREKVSSMMSEIRLTNDERKKAKDKDEEAALLQAKVNDTYKQEQKNNKTLYKRVDGQYTEIVINDKTNDLTNKNITKYRNVDGYFTPSPDTIYAGVYMNGDILLRNGSGKYLGTASWFEWDEDSGKVTMSKLDNLRRLYSFPSPRVRLRSETIVYDEATSEEEFYDVADDALDVNEEDVSDGIRFTDLVFYQNRWTARYVQGYKTAAEMTQDEDGRALLAALMTVEFTEQQPDEELNTEKTIFVASMDEMAVVAFDSTRGYVRMFLQLDPLASCYGFVNTHDSIEMMMELESTSDQVWEVSEDEYYDALIALATQLTE